MKTFIRTLCIAGDSGIQNVPGRGEKGQEKEDKINKKDKNVRKMNVIQQALFSSVSYPYPDGVDNDHQDGN